MKRIQQILLAIALAIAGLLGAQAKEPQLSGNELNGLNDPVVVVNPVEGSIVSADDPSALLGIADCNHVFLGVGLEFSVSQWGEGVADLILNPDGTVDLIHIPGQYGTVIVNLTATDAFGNSASTSFPVSIVSDQIFVDADTPAAPFEQTGYSWNSAFRTLQDALSVALPGQQIWVAAGVYYPDDYGTYSSDDRFDYFLMPEGVSLYGGFGGFESDLSQRDLEVYQSILSGDIRQDDLQQPIATCLLPQSGTANNSHNVIDLSLSLPGDRFDGFVVTAGYSDPSGWMVGAGIWVGDGLPTIANCLVSGNEVSPGNGAGLWIDRTSSGGSVEILNCQFVGNKAEDFGGAIYSMKGEVEVYNCEIRGNEARRGGGMYVDKDTFRLVNSVVSGNLADNRGGGLYVEDGQVTLLNSTFTGNASDRAGGAIRIYQADDLVRPLIENCIIWDNAKDDSTTAASASISVRDPIYQPTISNSLIANSGGSGAWVSSIGNDAGGNLDVDPLFNAGIDPDTAPTEAGNFTLQGGSPALDAGDADLLPIDLLDLDLDGDLAEPIELDLAGMPRVDGPELDIGAFEFPAQAGIHPSLVDSDQDGLSDEFELVYFGDPIAMDANLDLDGDGLTALGEFVHGQNPNGALRGPIAQLSATEVNGEQYLTVIYEVDPASLAFATTTVERRGSLDSPEGWLEDQTVQISSQDSPTNPGMIQIVARSLYPIDNQRMEFLRLRHDVVGP